MKRKLIRIALLAAAAGALAFGVSRQLAGAHHAPSVARLGDLSHLTRQLRLTPAQVAAIQPLHVALAARLKDCCTRHCDARARLGQTLAGGANANAQAEVLLTGMCRAYEESERATLDHIRQVRAILTPEQQTRFDAMIQTWVCGPCSMPGRGTTATFCSAHDHADMDKNSCCK